MHESRKECTDNKVTIILFYLFKVASASLRTGFSALIIVHNAASKWTLSQVEQCWDSMFNFRTVALI